MGKQINFFLTAADWAKIAAYLDKRGFAMFKDTSPTPSPSFVPLAQIGDSEVYATNIYLKTQESQLNWLFSEPNGFYWIDSCRSPTIEVLSGMDSPDSVYQGRFFYDPDFVADGEFVYKNEEFLEAARIFFNWVRRNFPAREEARGFYASDAALKKKLMWVFGSVKSEK